MKRCREFFFFHGQSPWHRAAFTSWRQCIPSQSLICTLVSEKSVFVVLFCRRHLRVLDAAFACIVPPRQLLVEEAAEDVSALGYSGRSFVQEVPAFIKAKKKKNKKSKPVPLFTGWLFIHRLFFEQGSLT